MKRIDHTQMGSGGQIERRNCAAPHRDSGTQQKKTSYTLYILKSIPAMGYPEAESDA